MIGRRTNRQIVPPRRLNSVSRPGILRILADSPPNSLIFPESETPSPTPKWIRRGNTRLPNKQRGAAERRGTLQNVTGRLNMAISPWYPPYFGGRPPEFTNIFCAQRPPFPQRPTGTGGGNETTEQATGRLYSAIPRWNPPYFGGLLPNSLFSASHAPPPTPNWVRRGETQPNHQTNHLVIDPNSLPELILGFGCGPYPEFPARVESLIFLTK